MTHRESPGVRSDSPRSVSHCVPQGCLGYAVTHRRVPFCSSGVRSDSPLGYAVTHRLGKISVSHCVPLGYAVTHRDFPNTFPQFPKPYSPNSQTLFPRSPNPIPKNHPLNVSDGTAPQWNCCMWYTCCSWRQWCN